MGFLSLLKRFLCGRVSPVVYIMLGVNIVMGFFFLTGLVVGGTESVLYASGVLLNRNVWGGLLLSSAVLTVYSLIKYDKKLTSIGGFIGWVLWLFAGISVALTFHWYIFITICLAQMAFHLYLYLASALGVLHNVRVIRPVE